MENVMRMNESRRRFLAIAGSAGAIGMVGASTSVAQEAPPETSTIRLFKMPGICIAPQYVAEEMLKSEGFTDIRYFDAGINTYAALASGNADIGMAFVANFIVHLDAGAPIVLLGGVHAGCYELFGTESVQAIRDLKGKTVAGPELGSRAPLFVVQQDGLRRPGPDAGRRLRRLFSRRVDRTARRREDRRIDGLPAGSPG